MKKYLPYIIGGVAVIALGILLISSVDKTSFRRWNERISLRQKDKIPYGYYAARQLLPSLFPQATIYTDKRSPGLWDSLSLTDYNQAVFIVGDFTADEEELENIKAFAQKGNYVFIICRSISYDATNFFGFNSESISSEEEYHVSRDSLHVRLSLPRFSDATTYIYPGRRFANYFTYVDPDEAIVLGRNGSGHANFLEFKAGSGSVYIHTAPLAFSNYFILHKNNIQYFEQVMSVIPATVSRVVWNEYYLSKKEPKEKEPNWLGVLFKFESFRWAFLTVLGTLLLYVLLEMRRKQRIIPVMQKPKNDSLDFVQTIGRLYYDQRNHKDLSKKMGIYFLDHVRSRYKIATNELDGSFVNALHAKTGYPVKDIMGLVDFIQFVNSDAAVSEGQLARFHADLEKFYQNM